MKKNGKTQYESYPEKKSQESHLGRENTNK
jgi:hypothetical protein